MGNGCYMEGSDEERSTETRKLMRVPLNGGHPEQVLSGQLRGAHCENPPPTLYVMAEWSADHRQVVFSSFDVLKGRGRGFGAVCEQRLYRIRRP
jgi:hypothetical protein